ncbi:MAG: hypothetical protein PHY93_10800 [Bacteriovorax sp.]|nr:hypothetical protein [Bacteriovorax sp.]
MKIIIFLSVLSFTAMAEEKMVCGKIKTLETDSWETKAVIENNTFYVTSNNQSLIQALIAAKISKSKICVEFNDPNGSSDGKLSINSLKL